MEYLLDESKKEKGAADGTWGRPWSCAYIRTIRWQQQFQFSYPCSYSPWRAHGMFDQGKLLVWPRCRQPFKGWKIAPTSCGMAPIMDRGGLGGRQSVNRGGAATIAKRKCFNIWGSPDVAASTPYFINCNNRQWKQVRNMLPSFIFLLLEFWKHDGIPELKIYGIKCIRKSWPVNGSRWVNSHSRLRHRKERSMEQEYRKHDVGCLNLHSIIIPLIDRWFSFFFLINIFGFLCGNA